VAEVILPPAPDEVVPRARPFLLSGGHAGVLLLHGFSGSIDTLRPLGAYLQQHGYTVFGARLAGHGGSEDALERSTRNDWRRSAAEALHLLQRNCSTVALVGDSLGALLALELSVAERAVAAVVALNPPLSPYHAGRNRLILPFVRRFVRYRWKRWVSPERRTEHLARGSSVRVPLRAYAEFLATAREDRRILSRISVPLLVLHARRDPTVHPAGAGLLFRRAGSSVKELHWVDDAVHHVVDAHDPLPIFGRILSFLFAHAPLR
jgi:carboxylesterase